MPDLTNAGLDGLECAKACLKNSQDGFFGKAVITEHVSRNERFSLLVLDDGGHRREVVFTEHGRSTSKSSIVIIPHWNAEAESYDVFAKVLSLIGFRVVVMVLEDHGPRRPSHQKAANAYLSANLGRTVWHVRRSVIEARAIIEYLRASGSTKINVVGISLGSCVAGLLPAAGEYLDSLSLVMSAGDFADVVWTGRATRHIREELEKAGLTINDLRRAWRDISLSNYIPEIAGNTGQLSLFSATYDLVVLPELTAEFLHELERGNVKARLLRMPCGHYTAGKLPFSAILVVWITLGVVR
jgi:hypothetical protein